MLEEPISLPDHGVKQMFFSTGGRLNRLRYFKRQIVLALLGGILLGVSEPALGDQGEKIAEQAIVLLLCWPYYCLDVRRLHDLGKGAGLAKIVLGGSILLFLLNAVFDIEHAIQANTTDTVPPGALYAYWALALVKLGMVLYFLLKKGESGTNLYGADPLKT